MKKSTTFNRRDFFALTGLGTMALNLPTSVLATENTEPLESRGDVKQLKRWLDTLLKASETADEAGNCTQLLQGCGRDCAQSHQMEDFAKKLRADAASGEIDALVEAVNKGMPGTHLEREGDALLFRYDQCYCQIRNAGWVNNPEFCQCTAGWNAAFFTALLEKPAKAELVQSIGRGDAYCLIRITA